MHLQLAAAPLRGGDELCCVISAVQVCRCRRPAAISIMFLDTLCSKKWYDMPHMCGIHSRIDRHSAVYN